MFDELHDPTPPAPSTAHLAAVAERGASMRRRRNAVIGSVSAVALIGAGALGVSALSGDSTEMLNSAPPDRSTTIAQESPTSTPGGRTADTVDSNAATTTSPVVSNTSNTVVTIPPTSASPQRWGPACTTDDVGGEVCPTFATLTSGVTIALDPAAGNKVTVYDGATSAFSLDASFDGAAPALLAVGPGDIGYVTWFEPGSASDGLPVRNVSAFELTGESAGQLVTTFDVTLDAARELHPDGSDYVPSASGLVAVTSSSGSIRPTPGSAPVVPWVNADADTVIDQRRLHFRVELTPVALTVVATGEGSERRWDQPVPESLNGMPDIVEVADGNIVYVFEPFHGAGLGDVPNYLRPDGTVDVGDPVGGSIEHVLSDGRFIVRMPGESSFTIIDPSADEAATPPARVAPVVAIDGNGDAVYFAFDEPADPILLYDGPDPDDIGDGPGDGPNVVVRVSVAPDGSVAYVGVCCSPIVGSVLETRPPVVATVEGDPRYGDAPVWNPAGTRRATAGPDGVVSVVDVATGGPIASEAVAVNIDTVWDLMWLDDARFAVLGSLGRAWYLEVYELTNAAGDGPVVVRTSSRPFSLFGETGFDALRFAGHPVGDELAVHEPGSDFVLSGSIDDFGNNNGTENGSSLTVIDLPTVALSAWFSDSDELIWIDSDRTLRVGDQAIAGEYTWARR